MPRLKLLAFDLDGTLLKEDKTISQKTKRMLTTLRQAGVEIALVTGRMYHFTVPVQELLGFPVHFVCTDGAYLRPVGWAEPLLATVDPAVTRTVLSLLREELSRVYLISNDRIHCFTAEPEPAIYSWGFAIRPLPEVEAFPSPGQVEQIIIGGEERKIRGIHQALNMVVPGIYMEIHPSLIPGYNHLLIRPPGVDKGSGLMRLAGLLRVEPAEIVAFGDWLNDLALFRDAGLAIAPANAVPEVKAKASIISSFSNEEDFIVFELERLFKEGKMVV